jgi:S-DNA-T family DNA segregation ATPase FtsK/SpoIIIE
LKNDKDYFQDAVNAWIELEWKAGKCHMNIQVGDLATQAIPYRWDINAYSDMVLPIPIGYSRTGLTVLDLPESPHLLIAGATGYGKTSMVASVIHSVMHRAIVVIIDLKGIDFEYLRGHCLVAITNEEASRVLIAMNKEFERRRDILRKYRIRKFSACPEEMPYMVLVIDELMELSKDNLALLDRLVRLARATGISVIAASQRTSTTVIPGDTRANFVARCCFKVPSAIDSRVVLGEDCNLAADLPGNVKGRCVYRFGIDTIELQSMFLHPDIADKMVLEIPQQRRWNIEPEPTPVPEAKTKRLRAR